MRLGSTDQAALARATSIRPVVIPMMLSNSDAMNLFNSALLGNWDGFSRPNLDILIIAPTLQSNADVQ